MTDQEIVRALRCCKFGVPCEKCPVVGNKDCFEEVNTAAAELIERLTAERPPEERVLVNVVWVNRAPEPYYERIKNVPFSDTACFYRGNWYWDSPVVLDLLAEYGEDASDLVDEAVEITHWMPLPEAPEAPGEGDKHE